MRYLANQRGRLFESDYLGPRVFYRGDALAGAELCEGWIFSVDRFVGSARAMGSAAVLCGYVTIRVMKAMSLIYPCYGFSNYMTDEELNHVRALYTRLR